MSKTRSLYLNFVKNYWIDHKDLLFTNTNKLSYFVKIIRTKILINKNRFI